MTWRAFLGSMRKTVRAARVPAHHATSQCSPPSRLRYRPPTSMGSSRKFGSAGLTTTGPRGHCAPSPPGKTPAAFASGVRMGILVQWGTKAGGAARAGPRVSPSSAAGSADVAFIGRVYQRGKVLSRRAVWDRVMPFGLYHEWHGIRPSATQHRFAGLELFSECRALRVSVIGAACQCRSGTSWRPRRVAARFNAWPECQWPGVSAPFFNAPPRVV